MYYPNQYRFYRSSDRQLVDDIAKAINGEHSAITCYEQLANLAPNEDVRKQIQEIRQDEIRHYQTFSQIYVNLTGSQHMPQMSEQCEGSYTDRLWASFKDEQETTDFYLDIAEKASDPAIQEKFRRASADEQNHAVWFLSFLTVPSEVRACRQPEPSDYGAKGALQASSYTLPSMLTYAIEDEYLAQARYDEVINAFGDVRTFVQIKEAEQRHIEALLPLFQKYNTPVPQNIAPTLVSVPSTLKNAYSLGVEGEIDNIAMYERFLTFEIPSDMRAVFTRLRDTSRNHLTAFERGAAREE
ncbi:rubrerythrin family protein [Paenibacillus sambharensis]|uniref:Rubrerythrin family protein n=1 Tax=Paenibacillus sambharensis TaxID=1803190 RepID=A0A2W1LUG0_9BACL|nr:ferritin family protein [Paenibacillus sambharensis]PZD95127.1 rubrerythrin family protein [Paenibacillus sambharensis]